jgi:hypothetical protein
MPQYVFVHKKTRGGFHYFIVYLAVGNRPVAVSRFAYTTENAALNDVIQQIRQGEQELRTITPQVPSAAAGGVR